MMLKTGKMIVTLSHGYFPMTTNMTGLDGFQKKNRPCALDESSLSIGRVKVILYPDSLYSEGCVFSLFSAFKELTRHVMNSMMGYIALPAILQKIMQVCFLHIAFTDTFKNSLYSTHCFHGYI